eukprot:5563046-Alexandrium_andersonii.AAC.1
MSYRGMDEEFKRSPWGMGEVLCKGLRGLNRALKQARGSLGQAFASLTTGQLGSVVGGKHWCGLGKRLVRAA